MRIEMLKRPHHCCWHVVGSLFFDLCLFLVKGGGCKKQGFFLPSLVFCYHTKGWKDHQRAPFRNVCTQILSAQESGQVSTLSGPGDQTWNTAEVVSLLTVFVVKVSCVWSIELGLSERD